MRWKHDCWISPSQPDTAYYILFVTQHFVPITATPRSDKKKAQSSSSAFSVYLPRWGPFWDDGLYPPNKRRGPPAKRSDDRMQWHRQSAPNQYRQLVRLWRGCYVTNWGCDDKLLIGRFCLEACWKRGTTEQTWKMIQRTQLHNMPLRSVKANNF